MSTVATFGGGQTKKNPPLTTCQVDLLKADNVASGTLPGLQELKIQPKTVKEVVPTYIGTRASGPH
jgi:hypothetical protein